MTPELWQQVKRLYESARRHKPEERKGFLDSACAGNPSLRRQVASLLDQSAGSQSPLESSALEVAARILARDQRRDFPPDFSGRNLAHYHITEKIGEGGMGVVYKARDCLLARSVAIKVLPGKAVADPEYKRRFIQEARTASLLNHPHIIQIHDIHEDPEANFIVMEFVDGQTLSDCLRHRRLPLGEGLKYAIQIADALAAAHEAGIIHRDLKPSNVMITHRGEVKLLDFGLAKIFRPLSADDSRSSASGQLLSRKGGVLGTVAYMSPEQAVGKPIDVRSDIFSFGSLLYEMVTGRCAFADKSFFSTLVTLAAVVKQDPIPPSQLAADIPLRLEKTIIRCLRKNPDRRWQRMEDIRIELENLLVEIMCLAGTSRLPSSKAHRFRSREVLRFLRLLRMLVTTTAAAWV